MIFGNLNFLTAYTLLKGRFRAFSRNGEIRLQALLIPLGALVIFVTVTPELYPQLGKAIRVSLFETVTALTTTGFSTVPYTKWNDAGVYMLIILMLIGGGACSTAGGIKQFRVYMLYRSLLWEFKRMLLPRNTITEPFVWQGDVKEYVADARVRQTGAFVFLYFLIYAAGVFVLTASGNGMKESLFEFASSLSTVGLTIGVTLPGSPAAALWAETIGMFLGRLEFFIVFIGIVKLCRDFLHIPGSYGKRG